jgi:dTDP-4-dehydrorhamnose 3,5-epimerase
MDIEKTGFEGVLVIKPEIYTDNRGYFYESFSLKKLSDAGIIFNAVQDNESKSSRGVIRGLHYQLKPFDQAKLIRVVSGRIFDVALDLRRNSVTFGKWYGIELDSEKKWQLLIPRGFAHGFSVLSESAVIQYKVDNFYEKNSERGIAYNDPKLSIDWKIDSGNEIVSEKDKKNPLLNDAELNF